MSGLRVWDANGNLIIDQGTRVGRILGVVAVTTSNPSGSINADFSSGTPFFFVTSFSAGIYVKMTVSISGNTLSWTPPMDTNTGYATLAYIYYGVR